MINVSDLKALRAKLLAKFNDVRLTKVETCQIEINNRMRSTAGRATISLNRIQLNGRLLSNNPEHLEQTFAHELAHLISYALYGATDGSGHGSNWQRVMHTMGYSPDRTHSLDVSGLRHEHKAVAKAKCLCGLHILKARKYNKIMRGSRYRCLKCTQIIELVR